MAKYDYVCPACGEICENLQELDEHQFNTSCEKFEQELEEEKFLCVEEDEGERCKDQCPYCERI